jgi:hypothetical protein
LPDHSYCSYTAPVVSGVLYITPLYHEKTNISVHSFL